MKLFIANPTYTQGTQNLTAQLQAYRAKRPSHLHHFEISGSLLTWCFNQAWAAALNLRESAGLTHFLLWHADIRPITKDWLDVFIDEFRASEADVMSAIVPIKDQRGLTSTARDISGDPWRPVRVTQHEANNILPVSWTSDDVLLNTGLMLCDFTKPWVEEICFTMRDRIRKDSNGMWVVDCEPEDWNFSRQCHKLGLKLVATRCVTVQHFGIGCWSSADVWGDETDQQNLISSEKVQVYG